MEIFYEWALAGESNCDVVLVAGDNTRLSAHKLILSGRSNVLKKCSKTEILLPEISGDALHQLHRYFYLEDLVIADVRMAEEFLRVAHRLELPKVASECERYLKVRLCTKNCLDQFEFGIKNSLGLAKVAREYIAAQLEELEKFRTHAHTYDAIDQEKNVELDETFAVVQDVLQQLSDDSNNVENVPPRDDNVAPSPPMQRKKNNTENDEKPFHCQQCDKAFDTRGS